MNIREKIYSGVFVLVVVGATIFLNAPQTENITTNTADQLKQQLQLSEVGFEEN